MKRNIQVGYMSNVYTRVLLPSFLMSPGITKAKSTKYRRNHTSLFSMVVGAHVRPVIYTSLIGSETVKTIA